MWSLRPTKTHSLPHVPKCELMFPSVFLTTLRDSHFLFGRGKVGGGGDTLQAKQSTMSFSGHTCAFHRSVLLRFLLQQIRKRSTSATATPHTRPLHLLTSKDLWLRACHTPRTCAFFSGGEFRKRIPSLSFVPPICCRAPAEETQPFCCCHLGFYRPIRIQ